MKIALNRIILTVVIITIGPGVFGQSDNEKSSDFPNIFIFGTEIDYNDTSITLTNKITIKHSVETCSIKAFKKNGKLKWNSKLPHSNCNIIYFKLLLNNKIKNSDILIQLSDKTMKGLNSKTGKMTKITPEELENFGKVQEKE